MVQEELTVPERALRDGHGEVVDVRAGPEPDRTVRAAVLAELLLCADAGRPPLRLRGARITGRRWLLATTVAAGTANVLKRS